MVPSRELEPVARYVPAGEEGEGRAVTHGQVR